MRVHGLIGLARIGLATLLRVLLRLPLWIAEALALAADLADPTMPESIRRPREWLWRLWSRWHAPDSSEVPH